MTVPVLIIGNKNYSSWSLRPWVYLRHHRIEFEEVRVALYREDSRRRILSYSPSGRVPVLQHDDVLVWDSLAILEYLAEVYPRSAGWPQDRGARAAARSICAEMHSGFSAMRGALPMNVRRRVGRSDWPAAVQHDVSRIQEIWALARTTYGDTGAFLFGAFSIADAMFAPVAFRFDGYDVPMTAIARQYVHDLLALPAMAAWREDACAESEVIEQFER